MGAGVERADLGLLVRRSCGFLERWVPVAYPPHTCPVLQRREQKGLPLSHLMRPALWLVSSYSDRLEVAGSILPPTFGVCTGR